MWAAYVPFPFDDNRHGQWQGFSAISGRLCEKCSDEAGLHERLECWHLGDSAEPREGFEDRSGADLADLTIFLKAIFASMQEVGEESNVQRGQRSVAEAEEVKELS
ncbi:unnamed protein product, partial [Symbiodinium sp. KB8]